MSQNNSQNEDFRKVTQIIEQHPVCMFTSAGSQGLVSHPMTVVKVEDNGELWFFSSVDSTPVDDISGEPEVNLTFTARDQWLSVRGSAAVITSESKARELWNAAADAFHPEGPESKNLVLIRVRPDGAQYWEAPGGAISIISNWVKARISGEKIDAGESHTVEL